MKTILFSLLILACAIPSIALTNGKYDYNANCAGCHGANANTQTEKAKALKMDVKKLALKASKKSKAEMIVIIKNGKGDMPGFKDQLTREQITGIVNYIIALRKK
jgi:mono/diheme cytochrome c family protein